MTSRPEGGFTLVELAVALFLLAILMSSSLYAILQGLRVSRDSQSRVVAADVVTGVLGKLRTASLTPSGFSSIPVTFQNLPSQIVKGTTITLSQTAEWVNRGVTSSTCNSGSNSSLVLRATVTASWGQKRESVSQTTLLAPPNGTLSAGNGSLPVLVDDSTGAGFDGATVLVTNNATSASQSIMTGDDGCAFFAQLAPGTYTVKVSSPGAVDTVDQSIYQATATVSAGSMSPLVGNGAIQFDSAGTVWWTPAPASPAPATGMPVSVDSSSLGLLANMYSSTGTNPMAGLYPATYNSLFAGSCTDADPVGLNKTVTRFYPTLNPGPITVPPAGSTNATVTLYRLSLQVQNSAHTALTAAASPSSTPPSAVAGASSLAGGGSCPAGGPTYTLNAVTTGTSSTLVGLGHLALSVTVTVGTTTYKTSSPLNLWIEPAGVYAVDSNGNATTQYYPYTNSAGFVPVVVS